jgi:phosphoglycolate phosphatase-like HAD superfamily hydrolase
MAMETPQSPPFEALIFDMDGVLIDSEALHERAKRPLPTFRICQVTSVHPIEPEYRCCK